MRNQFIVAALSSLHSLCCTLSAELSPLHSHRCIFFAELSLLHSLRYTLSAVFSSFHSFCCSSPLSFLFTAHNLTACPSSMLIPIIAIASKRFARAA